VAHRAKTQAGITRSMRREELAGLSPFVKYPPTHVPDIYTSKGPMPRGEQRPLVRLGHFSGNIYVVTKYKLISARGTKGVIEALRKYDVTDQVLAIVKAWSRFHNARRRKLVRAVSRKRLAESRMGR
jgi:hypothetical protein